MEKSSQSDDWSGLLPDLFRFRTTGITGLAAVAVTLGYWFLDTDIEALVMNYRAFELEPWRLLTSALPHSGYFHLGFNLYWLVRFGKILEPRYGSLATAAIYAYLTAGSSAAEYAFSTGGVGLSGLGYGQFGLLWVLSQKYPEKDLLSRETIGIFVGWFFLCIALTFLDIWSIGNVAHGAGATLGILAGLMLTSSLKRRRLWRFSVAAVLLALVGSATVGRPYVNFSGGYAMELSERAYDAIEKEDYSQAAELCRESLDLNGEQWHTWYNLGIAEWNLDRLRAAHTAFKRAYEIDSDDPDTRDNMIELMRELAQNDVEKGKYNDALIWYGDIRNLEGMEAADWFELGRAYQSLGRNEDSFEAFSEAVALEPDNEEYRSALTTISR
jgi:membrane associated rhomboid family serine protease/Tfp pilus assembly protein PilF